jgi:hypothetical protein
LHSSFVCRTEPVFPRLILDSISGRDLNSPIQAVAFMEIF